MGLQEKRAVKAFEESDFPELKNKLTDILGYEPELDVKWDQLAIEGESGNYKEYFPKVYFEPMFQVFDEVCQDDLGKEAMKEAVHRIVIMNEGGKWSATEWAGYEDHVLTLNTESCTNPDNVDDRAYYLKDALRSVL